MRILFAGASGVIGRHAVPMLVAAGHHVVGTSRSAAGLAAVAGMGATAVPLAAESAPDVMRVVREAAPEVVINMLTDLKGPMDFRRLDEGLAATNLLRTRTTNALLHAAVETGASRFIAQSFAGWFCEPMPGSQPAPLLRHPPKGASRTVAALRYLETRVGSASALQGVVLRFGPIYGPHTSLGAGGSILEQVRRRRVPIVGRGEGRWSFCHVQDAGAAVAFAVESNLAGVVDVVDDDPAPVASWLPELAFVIGAQPPRRVPKWLARPAIGAFGVQLMTRTAGASNAVIRAAGFTPRWPTWREGFRGGLHD
jgi:nucleoside-diphosphate-sugar epimerase